MWQLENSGAKDSEAKSLFSVEGCCDGSVMSAVGTGVGVLTSKPCICHLEFSIVPLLYQCGN